MIFCSVQGSALHYTWEHFTTICAPIYTKVLLFFSFFLDKSCKLSKIVSVLRSALVERFDVSRMLDFFFFDWSRYFLLFCMILTVLVYKNNIRCIIIPELNCIGSSKMDLLWNWNRGVVLLKLLCIFLLQNKKNQVLIFFIIFD